MKNFILIIFSLITLEVSAGSLINLATNEKISFNIEDDGQSRILVINGSRTHQLHPLDQTFSDLNFSMEINGEVLSTPIIAPVPTTYLKTDINYLSLAMATPEVVKISNIRFKRIKVLMKAVSLL